jgi:hypothetical protein
MRRLSSPQSRRERSELSRKPNPRPLPRVGKGRSDGVVFRGTPETEADRLGERLTLHLACTRDHAATRASRFASL